MSNENWEADTAPREWWVLRLNPGLEDDALWYVGTFEQSYGPMPKSAAVGIAEAHNATL